jgi:hypothetical protein
MVPKPRGILHPFGGAGNVISNNKAGNVNPHNEEETDRLVPGGGGAQEGRRCDECEDAVNDDDFHIPSKAIAVN